MYALSSLWRVHCVRCTYAAPALFGCSNRYEATLKLFSDACTIYFVGEACLKLYGNRFDDAMICRLPHVSSSVRIPKANVPKQPRVKANGESNFHP